MQRLLIKIVGEMFDGQQARTMGGLSGIDYVFTWSPYVNDGIGAYVHCPKDQAAIDDIFAVNRIPTFPWQFSVCMADVSEEQIKGGKEVAPLGSPTIIPPYVRPENYAEYPAEDLVELARNCGFVPAGDLGQPENLKRQLHAYFVGRSWAIEEVKRLRADNVAMKAKVEALPPEPEVAADPAPAVADEGFGEAASADPAPDAPRKRGRPRKTELVPA